MSKNEEKIELGPKTKVSLRVVISIVCATALFTAQWMDLRGKMAGAMSQEQFEAWVAKQQDANEAAFPALKWKRLPAREQADWINLKQ